MKDDRWLTAVFYLWLFACLFLGDGKDTIIDLAGSAGVLILFVLSRYFPAGRNPPGTIRSAWMALSVYLIIRTIFSDDRAYSVYTVVRWTCAYLIFTIFYTYDRRITLRRFEDGCIVFCLALFGVSLIYLAVPGLSGKLPLMNLLYPTYGHNHTADILLFGIPVVLWRWLDRPRIKYLAVLLILLAGVVLSFSRLAWIFAFAIMMVIPILRNGKGTKIALAMGVAFAGTAAFLLFFTSAAVRTGRTVPGPFLRPKQDVLSDGRWEFWRQALVAIRERPVFGSGPGTFYLQSRRLQTEPNTFSWYAHNSLLETTSDLGLAGLVLIAVFCAVVAIPMIRSYRGHPSPAVPSGLIFSTVFVTLYSLFEFNLSYLVPFFLLAAACGLLAAQSDNGNRSEKTGNGIFLLIPGVFYGLLTASLLLQSAGKNQAAFLAAPFRNPYETVLAGQSAITDKDKRVLSVFLPRRTMILETLAQTEKIAGPSGDAGQYYLQALKWDPQNCSLLSEYLAFESAGNATAAGALLDRVAGWYGIDGSAFMTPAVYTAITPEFIREQPPTTLVSNYLAKTAYFLGLSLREKNLPATIGLWKTAVLAGPDWGYYYAELASVYKYDARDEPASKKILTDCQKRHYPAELCRVSLQYYNDLPLPGTYEAEIQNIK